MYLERFAYFGVGLVVVGIGVDFDVVVLVKFVMQSADEFVVLGHEVTVLETVSCVFVGLSFHDFVFVGLEEDVEVREKPRVVEQASGEAVEERIGFAQAESVADLEVGEVGQKVSFRHDASRATGPCNPVGGCEHLSD